MTGLIRYYHLRLWRDIELPGLAVGLALLASMGFAGRGWTEVEWCFVIAVSSAVGTWVPAWCFRDGEADLGLPFGRTHLFLARVLAGAGFLFLCLLLAVAMGLVVSQGRLSVAVCDLLALHVFLGASFQLLGVHGAMCRKYGAQLICSAGAVHCMVAVFVSILAVLSSCDDAGLPAARILALFGAFVCLGLFAVTRERYLTWDIASDDDSIQGVSSASGPPCPRPPRQDRHGTGDVVEAPGRAGPPPWDHDRRVEDAAMVRGLVTTSRSRRPLSWAWLVVMRYGEFRPWLAILFLPMILFVMWSFIQGRRGGEGAHLLFVYVAVSAFVPECLQLSYLPISRRALFRIVCFPILLLFLAVWLAVTPWEDQSHARSCWVPAVRDGEIQTIGSLHRDALAFGASEVSLSDDSGYTRQATLDRSGGPVSFDPYEFDASDPPSFAVHQAQRYFHDIFSLVVPSAELEAAYERAPKQWLEIIDKRYARTRRANMVGRHLTAVGLISVAVLVLIRLCFHAMDLATRVRHVAPIAVLTGAVAYATAMGLGLSEDVRLKAALAMICDIVFRHRLLCAGIWLVCCTCLYLWNESAFEQLEPSASMAQKRRPSLGL